MSAANALNQALGQWPRVLSLHRPDGTTRMVFAHSAPCQVTEAIASWQPAITDGCVAIEWQDGMPVQTIGRAR